MRMRLIGGMLAVVSVAVLQSALVRADGSGDPAAVKDEGGKYFDKEASRPTRSRRRHGRLVHLFGLSPLSLGMPRLPWARRRGLDLCARPQELGQDDQLRRIRRSRSPAAARTSALRRKRDAGVRHQPERHVLHRRHLSSTCGRAPTKPCRADDRQSAQDKASAAKQQENDCLPKSSDDARNAVAPGGDRSDPDTIPNQQEATCGIGARPLRLRFWRSPSTRPPRAGTPGAGAAVTRRRQRLVDRTRRSEGAAGLRRPAQPAVLRRSGRGVRKQAGAAPGRKLGKSLAYTWYPQSLGFVRNTLGAPPLRPDHGFSARRRSGPEYQSLLPHDLCAGVQARQRPRRRRSSGRPATARASKSASSPARRRPRSCPACGSDGARSNPISSWSTRAIESPAAGDGRDIRAGEHRRRRAVGADRRLLRAP